MFKGFYTAASGMLAQQRKTEMLSNNMANSTTPGFKADQSSMRAFPELLQQSVRKNGVGAVEKEQVGYLATGVYMQEAIPKFTQGDLNQTELKTDLALLNVNVPGNGTNAGGGLFFTIQNANGEAAYSRNGNFTLDGQGYLTTASGLYVLDENNERIQLTSTDFTVTSDGVITSGNGEAYRLGISYTDTPEQLVKEGDGLYRAQDGAVLQSAYANNQVNFQVRQGFLENSNVDTAQTMTDMMTAYRAFEANQKILQAYDKSMDQAANEIGKI
ncbi:flagellar hook-basal body protein [Niallia alba]|uniref:Flagellar hook-basal body protein n=1 Tax=Niallia circulans TaxID=1397 RepID=A0A941JKV4_NIACI|nr:MULTISPECIES: flagellar hook-basal body protein [Niallia]MCB5236244.1 flagellar hook-basal body protein [Niallia circulans]MDU1846726.1 flagellar hook-basal body protein [Niallia nealsonii]MED3793305.1 flagellar hook-basal body protein [Niallia alba]